MADTKHAIEPVEGDGVNYPAIAWFIVILVGTVVFCQLLVLGLFKLTESRVVGSDIGRAPLAAESGTPTIERGRLQSGGDAMAPGTPGLLVDEPTVLREFQETEAQTMTTYGWVNQGAGVVRLPITRAKELALERGFPTRAAAPAAAPATPAPSAAK